jgi:hypothetical protein
VVQMLNVANRQQRPEFCRDFFQFV